MPPPSHPERVSSSQLVALRERNVELVAQLALLQTSYSMTLSAVAQAKSRADTLAELVAGVHELEPTKELQIQLATDAYEDTIVCLSGENDRLAKQLARKEQHLQLIKGMIEEEVKSAAGFRSTMQYFFSLYDASFTLRTATDTYTRRTEEQPFITEDEVSITPPMTTNRESATPTVERAMHGDVLFTGQLPARRRIDVSELVEINTDEGTPRKDQDQGTGS